MAEPTTDIVSDEGPLLRAEEGRGVRGESSGCNGWRVGLSCAGLFACSAAVAAAIRHVSGQALPERPEQRNTAMTPVTVCNSTAPLPGPAKLRVMTLSPPWDKKCRSEAHFGHWDPQEPDIVRNWCWAIMKHTMNKRRFDDPDVLEAHPLTWQRVQQLVADQGLAPPVDVERMYPLQQPELCEVVSPVAGSGDISAEERTDALEWMRQFVTVYVVNLPSATERLRNITARLQHMGIEFVRVAGVDGSAPGIDDKLRKEGVIPDAWSYKKFKQNSFMQWRRSKTGGFNHFLEEAGRGNVGCAAAHMRALKEAADSPTALALILEDDAVLADEFPSRLQRLLYNEAPCDWQAINLKAHNPYGACVSSHLFRVHSDGNEPYERCRHASSWAFTAMLYRVRDLESLRQRLAEAVWDLDRPACIAQDVALASMADKVSYYAVPAVQKPGFVAQAVNGGVGYASQLLGSQAQLHQPAAKLTSLTR